MSARDWRMLKPCADCPFSQSKKGTHLRRTLRPGRIAGIKRDLLTGAFFMCHKTTRGTGDGSNRLCAGALAWQHARGQSSNYERVCEALDYFAEQRVRRAKRRSGDV